MPEVRLIDANALYNDLKESVKDAREWKEETQDEEIKIRAEQAYGTFIECALRVKHAPTIEPEVRRGRWIKNGKRSAFGDLEYLCSECGRKITVNWAVIDPSEYNAFCSGCGARMDAADDQGGSAENAVT